MDFGSASGDVSADGLCVELDFDLDLLGLEIVLPVGFSLSVSGPVLPHPGDVSGRLLAQANAALAPLSPLFDLVDMALLLGEMWDAAKKLPKVKPLTKLIPKFKAKLDRLRKLVPQLSVPVTVKSVIRVLVAFLRGMKLEIEAIVRAQSSISLARQRALSLGLVDLTASLDCAQANLDAQFAVLAGSAAPLNRLINTINVFCDVAKLKRLPGLTIEVSAGASAAVHPIDVLIAKLDALDKALKV